MNLEDGHAKSRKSHANSQYSYPIGFIFGFGNAGETLP